MHDVFINYRTGDGEKSAALIAMSLSDRFGKDRIFRASQSIGPGEHFPARLLGAVRRSAVLLAVIGPEWIRSSAALHDQDDWVRKEIAEAFACGIPVIPVLEGRTTERLDGALLPAELVRLAEVQYVRLDYQNVQADLTRIGDMLAARVPSLKEADRLASRPPGPDAAGDAAGNAAGNAVGNAAGDVYGTSVQSRDITGDVGTVTKHSHGPVHLGKGDLYSNSPRFSGDGATYVAGDNQGGIRHRFGGSRGNEDGDR
ncbi:toll/interleukin-1 receptor domain-containing protein [Planomonospora sp. ID82291]|uniref:toll/interleukin-1 receptor domain-containing protein n=1 Tax=Planomonospora sp. ID82291 TaxID=2738136 RepID=UPI0018C3D4C6|nr:toll/interleukin-1 receptor domain-containing protein [Planomonospora sp. ID82291]MBG0817565.1 toll/interleukin-1 receptor domain-containing protein [Planomonospora sp. ID82291]